ncbi:MAG: hypothetical protein IJE62_03970, partial [Clostridia bacterium]|nr:hypothetical protein [Clostridia bacterium]
MQSVRMNNQKRGEIHLAFAMYKNRQKTVFDTLVFNRQTSENRTNTDYFVVCPKITHSSILLTIPVAVSDSVSAGCRHLPIVDRCHSLLLASSATGSARKRPLLLSYINLL